MTNKFLTMYDQLGVSKPKLFSDTKSLMNDLFGSGAPTNGYKVVSQIRATHSGYLCNNRVYPGKHMADSVGTWCDAAHGGTASFNKPVLIHHRQSDGMFGGVATDPIGRIIAAKFDKIKDGDEFINDYRKPATGTDFGSGFITLTASITDPEAIQKVIDGRYDSVSVGFNTKNAICSICGEDWLNPKKDSDCEHQPGMRYEEEKNSYLCYLVTGPMDYREVSYVNVPAQPNAKTLSNNIEALQGAVAGDSSKPFVSYGDNSSVLALSICDAEGHTVDLVMLDGAKDSLPDSVMDLKKKKVFAAPDVSDLKPTDKADKVISASINKEETVDDAKFALMHVADSIVQAGMLDKNETVEGCDLSYAEIQRLSAELKTAKLSTDQRKKLKGPSFCGPNQTLPVSDVEHLTAARRLLDRVTLSSDQKARVRAILDKKAVSMGVKEMTADNKDTPKEPENKVSDYSLSVALEAITQKKDELEKKVTDLQSALDAKVTLCNELTDEVSKLKAERIKGAAKQLAIINVNLQRTGTMGINSKEKFDVYVDSLAKRTYDSLCDSISDSMPEIDMLMKNRGSTHSKLTDTKVENPVIGNKDDTNNKAVSDSSKTVNKDKKISKDTFLETL